jgi:hypothetical protein
MTITCQNASQFFDSIEELVKRGLTFKAYHETFTITLTGGH